MNIMDSFRILLFFFYIFKKVRDGNFVLLFYILLIIFQCSLIFLISFVSFVGVIRYVDGSGSDECLTLSRNTTVQLIMISK